MASIVQGYAVEEATGILVAGDVELISMTMTSLPVTHPSYYPELVLEQGDIWKAPPLPKSEIELFVGIMSNSNHFAERMAVRKTWLQSKFIQSSQVVARFFVALVRVMILPNSCHEVFGACQKLLSIPLCILCSCLSRTHILLSMNPLMDCGAACKQRHQCAIEEGNRLLWRYHHPAFYRQI